MNTALATRSQTLVELFEKRRKDVEDMLDGSITPERFIRTVKNAILRDPEIAEADPTSVFLEVQKAAQDGLVLDGREAVLTRFKTRQQDGTYRMQVAYIPMILGIKKRVMQSGMVKAWTINLVYENEMKIDPETGRRRFAYYAGDNPRIEHEPIIIGPRGQIVGAYSAVRLADGSYHHEFMTVDQLRAIKARTKSKDKDKNVTGPWKTDEEEMFRKTVARRHSKSLPMSSEDRTIVERVDALYDFDKDADDIYSAPPVEQPKAVAKKKTGAVAEKLKATPAAKMPEQVEDRASEPENGETVTIDGEVIDRDEVPVGDFPEDVF